MLHSVDFITADDWGTNGTTCPRDEDACVAIGTDSCPYSPKDPCIKKAKEELADVRMKTARLVRIARSLPEDQRQRVNDQLREASLILKARAQ